MSDKNSCYSLYPNERWDYEARRYITMDRPERYDGTTDTLMFANCCGADFDDQAAGPYDNPNNAGIFVAARHIPDLDPPERAVAYVQTKNGPLTIVTATSWSEYDPNNDEDIF